jgi:hypothetical protein
LNHSKQVTKSTFIETNYLAIKECNAKINKTKNIPACNTAIEGFSATTSSFFTLYLNILANITGCIISINSSVRLIESPLTTTAVMSDPGRDSAVKAIDAKA